MRCTRCESDDPNSLKFCIECGIPLSPCCPRCGADILPRAKFYSGCGTPLSGQTPAPHASYPSSPLGYTPGHLAEQILTSKTILGGERKHITALFADLKGCLAGLPGCTPVADHPLRKPLESV